MRVQAYAPSRISLFGGGSDLPDYYAKYGGVVVSMAINLKTQIDLYTQEDSWGNPGTHFPFNANPDLYYSILNSLGMGGMHAATSSSQFDGVISAGLGSSASFAVALITAIKKLKGDSLDRTKIAELAWEAEKALGRIGGKQDQYAAAFGGFNVILFPAHGKLIEIFPYQRGVADHTLSYMKLFYIGGTRQSSTLQKTILEPTEEQLKYLQNIKDAAYIAQKALLEGKMDIVGKLLHYSWEEKKKLNKNVSNDKIDEIYAYARENGAMGGKLCGAGGAGYMMFFVSPEKQKDFVDKMWKRHLEPTDFSYNYEGVEARIL